MGLLGSILVEAAATVLVAAAVGIGTQVFERYAELLDQHVDGTHIDYAGMADDAALASTVAAIATADLSALDRNQRLAFLINAYNVLVIDALANGRRFDSLLGRWRFFKRHEVTVAGHKMSLHDLEREWISALGEPRAHFALACAAVSCPRLRGEPYTATELDQQLDEQAVEFINDSAFNRFDDATRMATVSKLFRWHRRDFGGDEQTLLSLLGFYHRDPDVAAALSGGEYSLDYMTFDWDLAAAPAEPIGADADSDH